MTINSSITSMGDNDLTSTLFQAFPNKNKLIVQEVHVTVVTAEQIPKQDEDNLLNGHNTHQVAAQYAAQYAAFKSKSHAETLPCLVFTYFC